MKKLSIIILVLVLTFAFSSPVFSSGSVNFGIKAGLNLAKWVGDDSEMLVEDGSSDKKFRTGFSGGVLLCYQTSEMFALQPEMIYTMKGSKYEGTEMGMSYDATFTVEYLEIPVLAKIIISTGETKPYLLAGPALGVLLSSKGEVEVGGISVSDELEDVKSIDFGLILGAGINIDLGTGTLLFDARYNLGLTSIDDSADDGDIKNSVISFNVGYLFK